MSDYTIKSGDTLWNVAIKQYNIDKNDNNAINKKISEIAKANNISNPNLIYSGAILKLDNSIFSKPTTQTKKETRTFSDFTKECAESISYVDDKENNIYSKDVKDLDMVGDEYRQAIANKNYDKVGEIYKKQVTSFAQQFVSENDQNKDNIISQKEFSENEIKTYERYYGQVTGEMKSYFEKVSKEAFNFMDLDRETNKNNKGVDVQEYSAFLKAMDASNEKFQANGKISREEYVKTSDIIENKDSAPMETAKLRGTVRSCFKSLYGYDSGEKK